MGYGLLGHGPRTSANQCVASGASLAPDLVEVAQSEQLRGRLDEYFKALPPDERQRPDTQRAQFEAPMRSLSARSMTMFMRPNCATTSGVFFAALRLHPEGRRPW
jgi:hypothetical protein